ncbi:hypothetical protein PYW08_015768 [Mythimna loreyi]|uniref:Uncharacterized protein n=1 Tax=Mythimna loreyi TaxID=667449 RepID=A0ACC2QRN3_9NEOP|nr:hypothetical protein PYW08_015768 [Mythimna loreyi]
MATAVTDDWTEEKCLQLIREFRLRPVLWDPKDPYFFKKKMKPMAWQEIGDKIDISPDRCKHKMIILMSSFRREKAKIMHSLKSTTDPSMYYKSTWFAFKDMAFLMDKENERKRRLHAQGTDDDDDDDSFDVIQNTILRNHIGTPVPMKRYRRESIPLKREAIQKVVEEAEEDDVIPVSPQSHSMPGPSQTAAERDEEIKSFATFIGNKMKKYSDATKNAVQQAICEIIFKADQNDFEPHCFEKFTIIDDDDPLNKAIYDSQFTTVIKVQHDSDDSS